MSESSDTGRNILIFSDGTGLCGGLFPDEQISNIYKLYRATRSGPCSTVNPLRQLAFYDPGLGSQDDNGRIPIGWVRSLYNALSQSTGLGIYSNIRDCYAALLKLWRPGDRIYLFGFSRGAYTVRCLGGVLSLCGMPLHEADGSPLRYDDASLNAIAHEAVKHVYQYGASIKDDPFKALRRERGRAFRERYGSDTDGRANELPYFIGVFDTVASLGVPSTLRWGIAALAGVAVVGLGALIGWRTGWGIGQSVLTTGCIAFFLSTFFYLKTHLYWHPVRKRFFLANWSMQFYDLKLNPRVGYARHAISIDEDRTDFQNVPWEFAGDCKIRALGEAQLLHQVWFAGCHGDIGGGYEENEARLSDMALNWMVEQLQSTPHPLDIDHSALQRFPSALGMQHDEGRKPFPGIWGKLGFRWGLKARNVPEDAILHDSVLERFEAPDVLDYDKEAPYRPEPLRNHPAVKHYYSA